LKKPFFESLFFKTFNAFSTSLSITLTSKNVTSFHYSVIIYSGDAAEINYDGSVVPF